MNNVPAKRITLALTSAWEKENLPKIARALPAWVVPDHLTLLGVIAAFGIAAGYLLSHWSPYWLLLSIAGLFVHWLGDSLDGTLARVRKIEREQYGYYVDRTADAISIVTICMGFGLSPFVSATTGMLLAISYLMIMVHAELCAYVSRTFPMSFARLGPTEARIALATFTLLLMFWSPRVEVLDALGMTASGFLVLSFLVLSVLEARRLDRAERIAKAAIRPSAC